jgi:hypothetical protein
MATCTVLTEMLNTLFLALTPVERWQAARRLDASFMMERWFIVTAAAVLIALTLLLIWVSYKRIVEQQKVAKHLFLEYAERRGLSVREHQLLLQVAKKSGLKRRDAIFTLQEAFERGVTKLMEDRRTLRQTPQDIERLRAELSLLREKLGFRSPESIAAAAGTNLSSRHIPVGKKVYITRRTTRSSEDIEAQVTENSETELTVKLKVHLSVSFSETWRVYYYSGKSIWEFDTSAVSYDGGTLVLNHSDSVRVINRRRFLRVPVHNLAFIAKFPFARTIVENGEGSDAFSDMAHGVANAASDTWKPLEFVHAVVTELAGPGLRIEAPLKVKEGERVLVVFKLDEKMNLSPTPVSKIIEDIGEVRHSKAIKNGRSIAVELIGLRDSDVRELIQATNAASLRAGTGRRDKSTPAGSEQQIEEDVAEPATT